MYLLCDTYVKWKEVEPHRPHSYHEDYVFYAALEWDVYNIFAVVLSGMKHRDISIIVKTVRVFKNNNLVNNQ